MSVLMFDDSSYLSNICYIFISFAKYLCGHPCFLLLILVKKQLYLINGKIWLKLFFYWAIILVNALWLIIFRKNCGSSRLNVGRYCYGTFEGSSRLATQHRFAHHKNQKNKVIWKRLKKNNKRNMWHMAK